ncbi:hypothetical protein GCM10008955_36950 [Deinococcus malanensis]|uniref:Response regulator n=1 Tax=Deinococcus malanensis TaxID=1706855 RepID=A0ABQ2F3W9_9DEIO|nr:response regulator [Deinococcus malanensis]GGK39728.1 hypothetical protein GCM10008955_36950 [Deinococcus malanensis]
MNKELHRVLLVEDDADIQAVALIALEDIGGLQVQTCDTGFEALERFEQFGPDLVLMDVMMPGLSGPETLTALRALPGGQHVPVAFMTAKVQRGEVQEYLSLGAVGVIPKPFEPMTLADDLRALLQTHYAGTLHVSREEEEERAFQAQLQELNLRFTEDLPVRVAGLRETWEAVRRHDVPPHELSRQAHSLVGTGATLGFGQLAQVAARIEDDPALTGKRTLDAQAAEHIESLLVELEAVARAKRE